MIASLDLLAKTRVLVVGDVMLDCYYAGECRRISPEAPVPIVQVDSVDYRPGGAGNVALNVAALGAQVMLVGAVGDDDDGKRLTALLHAANVNARLPLFMSRTITKARLISRHQQLVRFDFEQSEVIDSAIVDVFTDVLDGVDAVIISDYAKGVCAHSIAYINAARLRNIPVFVDPKGDDFSHYAGATLLTPNIHEFERIVGKVADDATLHHKGRQLIEQLSLTALVVTRGEAGMSIIYADRAREVQHYAAEAHEVFDVTGAGDTVIATLATAMGAGIDIAHAARLANMAAGIVVGKLGAATVTPTMLLRAMHLPNEAGVVVTTTALLAAVHAARMRGERIVMTNGCFDLLHPGHIDSLMRARDCGDRLIVAINSDASVQALKGDHRPIQPVAARARVLAALRCVDWVCVFDAPTPVDLIAQVMPDVLVKGGDYHEDNVAGADIVRNNGGQVHILPLLKGHSTTDIIDRIRGDS